MGIYDDLHSGKLYFAGDKTLLAKQQKALGLQELYNATGAHEEDKRRQILQEMFMEVGEGVHIEPPLYANWAGKFVRLGKRVYINFHLTMVDDTYIEIGDDTMIGPNVTLATANHPLNPDIRKTGVQYNRPIKIGKNVWIGAGVIVFPGVTIGDNSVIGAGSLVTKDIPAGVLAYGSPCRVISQLPDTKEENLEE